MTVIFYKTYRNLPISNVISSISASIATSFDAGWKVTIEDVSTLKKTLIQVLTETFCKQLIATTQEQTTSDKSFVEALLRRLKRLIQFVPVQ